MKTEEVREWERGGRGKERLRHLWMDGFYGSGRTGISEVRMRRQEGCVGGGNKGM